MPLEYTYQNSERNKENDFFAGKKMENKNDVNIFAELRKDLMIAVCGGKSNCGVPNFVASIFIFVFVSHLRLARLDSCTISAKHNKGNEMQNENQYYKQINVYRPNVNL